MKINFLTLIFISITCLLNAQDFDKWAKPGKQVYYEKLYLHTDRELYSPGDTIWLKSYLVSGLTHKLSPDYRNIYVQLISKTGRVITNRLLLSEFGEAHGEIALADTLAEGQYMLRARTKYQENFGEESYFHKRLWVNKAKSSLELDIPEEKTPEKIEAMYFPEGGNMVVNAPNQVAFKVIGTDGRGLEASGVITNQQNDTITKFSTSFLGMGCFVMMPKAGEKYYATINDHPESKQELSNILNDGFALNFKDEGDKVLFAVSRDFKQTGKTRVYLTASFKGIELFHEHISVDGFSGAISLSKSRFLRGINKITLSDSYYNVLAERLVFIDDDYGNTVKVEVGKKEYSTREKVSLKLEPILPINDTVTSTLSVSVISEDYLEAAGSGQNIKSYLLLDSELKGEIEMPALYFTDAENITAQEKLDLLMMVQGWRSYYWDDIIEMGTEKLSGLDDAGLTISGHVKKLFGNKSIIGGDVMLVSVSPKQMFEKMQTDSLGNFKFKHLYLTDFAEVMVLGTNERGGRRVEVIPDTLESYKTNIDPSIFNQMLGEMGIPMKYYRSIYLKEMALKKYTLEGGTIFLDEITVNAKIKDEERYELISRFSGPPDKSFFITPDDYKFENVKIFVRDKVGSRWVDKYWVSRSGYQLPRILYIVDGHSRQANYLYRNDLQQSSENIPIEDVYRIDLNITTNIDEIGKEVYNIYTKANRTSTQSSKLYKNVFTVRGFQKPNKFYSPKYTLENIHNKKPDLRSTLFWSSEVEINNGTGAIEFFTCDNLSRYVVIVEGISKKGNICYGVSNFSVTSRTNTNN